MQEIFKILPNALRDEGVADELNESIVLAAFRRIAGESLRGNAVPFRLYQKQLVVAVVDEAWKNQLEMMSGQLLFKLNATIGKPTVTFIEFRIDPKTIDKERDKLYHEQKSRLEQERMALKNVPPDVRAAAENIADDKLRRNFLLAAGSCLARKNTLKIN